jgi:hypothetical protein
MSAPTLVYKWRREARGAVSPSGFAEATLGDRSQPAAPPSEPDPGVIHVEMNAVRIRSVSFGACSMTCKPSLISYGDTPRPLTPNPPKPFADRELPLPGQLTPIPWAEIASL